MIDTGDPERRRGARPCILPAVLGEPVIKDGVGRSRAPGIERRRPRAWRGLLPHAPGSTGGQPRRSGLSRRRRPHARLARTAEMLPRRRRLRARPQPMLVVRHDAVADRLLRIARDRLEGRVSVRIARHREPPPGSQGRCLPLFDAARIRPTAVLEGESSDHRYPWLSVVVIAPRPTGRGVTLCRIVEYKRAAAKTEARNV